MAKVKVEFIESYIHEVDEGGSYIWNDNHGELIRCRDCIHVGHDIWDRGIYCKYHKIDINDDDYCSYGKRKEKE